MLALVLFFTVALSLFTAFPAFGWLRDELGQWLVDQLIPASIADSVLEHLSVFTSKASQMGVISLAVFGFTTLSLLLTVDHTLNAIWRVRQPRPLSQRLLVYWAALTLGPLLMGASLAITSYVAAQSGLWLAAAQGDVARHAGQGLLALLKFVQLTRRGRRTGPPGRAPGRNRSRASKRRRNRQAPGLSHSGAAPRSQYPRQQIRHAGTHTTAQRQKRNFAWFYTTKLP